MATTVIQRCGIPLPLFHKPFDQAIELTESETLYKKCLLYHSTRRGSIIEKAVIKALFIDKSSDHNYDAVCGKHRTEISQQL